MSKDRGRARWQSRQAQTPQTPGLNGPDAADIHAKLKRVLANAAEERGKTAESPGGTAAAAEGSLPLNLCGNEAEKRRICNLLNARPGDYPCGLLICDAMERDVTVVYANGYLEDATGYAQHEILGRPYNFAQRRGVYATAEHELVDRTTSAELATALQKVGVACIISGSPPLPGPNQQLGIRVRADRLKVGGQV
jgi:PAS domain-containing protein